MTYFRKFVNFKDDKECDLFVCYVKKQNKNKENKLSKKKNKEACKQKKRDTKKLV